MATNIGELTVTVTLTKGVEVFNALVELKALADRYRESDTAIMTLTNFVLAHVEISSEPIDNRGEEIREIIEEET